MVKQVPTDQQAATPTGIVAETARRRQSPAGDSPSAQQERGPRSQHRQRTARHPAPVSVAVDELARARTIARSLLSRVVYLADAPAATLATPFQVRRAAQGMANDASTLCGLLDTLAGGRSRPGREGIA